VDVRLENSLLVITLRIPQLDDSTVRISTRTTRLAVDVPIPEGRPHRTCFAELRELKSLTGTNDRGFIVPPADFGALMRDVRDGIYLTYGLRAIESYGLLRIVSARIFVACVVRDLADVRCDVVD